MTRAPATMQREAMRRSGANDSSAGDDAARSN
ncbi:hypothetical protein K883_05032, partial [Mycobacterium sp. TKK-01-0059]